MPKLIKYTYTKEMVEQIVPECLTMAEVCRRLNLPTRSGTHASVSQKLKEWEVDTSHFLGKRWKAGQKVGGGRPIEELLVLTPHTIPNANLKRRLIRSGLMTDKCSRCGISEWQGRAGICDLDHINSNPRDNRLDNLQLLCPNCHRVKTKEDWEKETTSK